MLDRVEVAANHLIVIVLKRPKPYSSENTKRGRLVEGQICHDNPEGNKAFQVSSPCDVHTKPWYENPQMSFSTREEEGREASYLLQHHFHLLTLKT